MRTILRRLAAFSAALSLCICISALSGLADGGSEGDVSQVEAPAESVQAESEASVGVTPTDVTPAEEDGANGNGMTEENVPGSAPTVEDPEDPS